MHSERVILELVDLVYGAAADPRQWTVLLRRLAEILHGNVATIHHQHLTSMQASFASDWNMDPAAIETYAAHYAPLNLWFTTRPELLQEGHILSNERLCPDEVLLRSEFHNDWLKPNDMRHALGAMVLRSGSTTCSLSVFRPAAGREFHDEDERLMSALMPHLQRAFQLHNRIQGLEQRGAAAADALDQLRQGVILLGATGHVLLVNQAATAILGGETALKVTAEGLRASISSEHRQLSRLIQGAIDTGTGQGRQAGGAMSISRAGVRRPLQVLVIPLRARVMHVGDEVPVAAIFVSDPERQAIADAALFTQLFGLTRAESRLAEILAAGASPKDAAERLGVAESTVRSQLKSVFAKTNTNRQSQLVRTLLATPQREPYKAPTSSSRPSRPR